MVLGFGKKKNVNMDEYPMFPLIMFSVALSRCAYDSPVRALNNLCVLFNLRALRNLLDNLDKKDGKEDFLKDTDGFSDVRYTNLDKKDVESQLPGDEISSSDIQIATVKRAMEITTNNTDSNDRYRKLSRYINTATDIVLKNGYSTKAIQKLMRESAGIGLDSILDLDHLGKSKKYGPLYDETNTFMDKEERKKTSGKIRYYYICSSNDLNCYIIHHTDYNIIYVVFRGTLSAKSAVKDLRYKKYPVNTKKNKKVHKKKRGFRGGDINNNTSPSFTDVGQGETGQDETGQGETGQDEGIVHLGFLENLDQVFSRICYCIVELQKDKDKPCKVITTGHSLGGAITTIFSYLYARYYHIIESLCKDIDCKILPLKKIRCVAVSAPKIGNEKFSEHYMEQIVQQNIEFLNVFNRKDIVTKLPPSVYGSRWWRVGGPERILLCNNSAKTRGTNYKKNLKCTSGKAPSMTDIWTGSNNPHLGVYYINFYGNLKSTRQLRPETKYLRIIRWNAPGRGKPAFSTIFIDDWRCNHVLNKESYNNEMETAKVNDGILFKVRDKKEGVQIITSIQDSGQTEETEGGKIITTDTNKSVRFRNYTRSCKKREEEGTNTPNMADKSSEGEIGETVESVKIGGRKKTRRKRRKTRNKRKGNRKTKKRGGRGNAKKSRKRQKRRNHSGKKRER